MDATPKHPQPVCHGGFVRGAATAALLALLVGCNAPPAAGIGAAQPTTAVADGWKQQTEIGAEPTTAHDSFTQAVLNSVMEPASDRESALGQPEIAAFALGSKAGDEPVQSPPPAEPAPEASENPLTPQQQRQLQVFSVIVLNPSADIDAETRRSAAQELLAMNLPQSLDVLDQALRSQKPAVMAAAISAMQSAAAPVNELMESAIAALPAANAAVLESLAWAVARYGDAALRAVSDLALNRANPTAARLGPVRALGAFDSQSAAAALMRILNTPEESNEIVAAACEGLQRLSGLNYGSDVPQWRQWWKEAGALPAGQWTAFITKSLAKRAAQLQQDLQKQRESTERISRELSGAYRDLFPALPTEEQLRRIPPLLQNPLAPVREFAISRIGLLMRDSVRIPTELQQKLAERLNDDAPDLRVKTAKLLDELNYEPASQLIAARLATEQSPQVIAGFFDVLTRRPCVAAIEPARKWIADHDVGDAAAIAIWRVFETTAVPMELIAPLRSAVRNVIAQRFTPAMVRLMACIGDEDDRPELDRLLDGGEPDIRVAVGEGYIQRGLRQPLIDRAADAAVFPLAVRAVADGPADLAAFRLLVSWKPDAPARKTWRDAVLKMAGRLPNAALLAADEALAAASYVDADLRAAVLVRAAQLKPDELSTDQRVAVVRRLAPILIDKGESIHAFELLSAIGGDIADLKPLLFQAAALSGHYELAMELQVDPTVWVALLSQQARRDLTAAEPLCQEIARRFAGRLNSQDQDEVDRITEAIRQAGSASVSATSQPASAFQP